MIDEARLAALLDAIESRFDLAAAWLFGSEARRQARPDSDVDLALLFARSPSADELLMLRGEAEMRLGREVDLVDLGAASPILARQVLRNGRLIRDRASARRIAFEAALPGRYEDLRRLRRPCEEALVARTLNGRS